MPYSDPAKNKASKDAYYQNNKELCKRQAAEWVKANREKSREIKKRWEIKNKEKIRLHRANRDQSRIREQRAAWVKEHPEYPAVKQARRRAREKGNGGELSWDIKERLLKIQRGKCSVCKTSLKNTGSHLDHIIPLSKGGDNSDRNVQVTCPTCNHKKQAKDPIKFMQEMGYLL